MSILGRFSPEFMALVVRASREPVEILLPSKNRAINLRHRFHSFRRRCLREAAKLGPLHTLQSQIEKDLYMQARILEQVETSLVSNPDGSATLIIRPLDITFLEAIRAAGISIDLPIPESVPSVSSVPTTKPLTEIVDDPIGDYLKGDKKS